MTRTASCQCGLLRLTVEGEPAFISACSCMRCQKRSGSLFSLSSRWKSNQVKGRTGNSLTFNRKGASGGNVQCVLCPICGSTVSTSLERLPDLIVIPVGRFADPTFSAPTVAVWCESELEWVRFPNGILLLRGEGQPMETQ